MSKIKTREKAKDIKVLDKFAVVGQRMKNAFIRSKRNAAALMDDQQATPSEYAEDKVEFAADDLVHDTVNVAVSGTKTAVRQGRRLFQRQREKMATEKRREERSLTEQAPFSKPFQGEAPNEQPLQGGGGTVPKGQLPHPRIGTASEQRHLDNTENLIVERGRTFTKGQAARKRQEKHGTIHSDCPTSIGSLDTDKPPWQIETAANAWDMPVKTVKRPIERTVKTGDGGETITGVQRRIKTAQRTSKPVIKTNHTAKAAQKTLQVTRATGKDTAAAAEVTKRGISASVNAIAKSAKAFAAAIAAGGWAAILAIVMICLIGLIAGSCFGIFFSGEDSGAGQTMPAVVREINQDYEEELEEIRSGTTHDTLEMSGSRAIWPEVLALYAVKTNTTPDSPQEVATMDDGKKDLLREIFWAMNEISHRTETATITQAVETDDGAGNIIEEEVEVTTTTLYITVTHKTADEMADAYNFTADQRAQLAELLAEENRSMWSSVLYGIGAGDGEIVAVALSQLGNVGGQPYWSWYGFSSRVEWCACFVSWCANECGYIDTGVIPKFAGPEIAVQWFRERGLWQGADYEPRPGDIIFFDWDNRGSSGPQNGFPNHVGIVERVEGGMVYTIEGNTGDSCKERRYAVGYYEILGYGVLCP